MNARLVRKIYVYDPTTGVLRRRVGNGKRQAAGALAGHLRREGYIRVVYLNEFYYAHHLVWLYVYGRWPTYQLDHMDGDRSNNRIANLRDVSNSINQQNQKRATSRSTTGLLGSFPHRDKFQAKIQIDKKVHCLGTFDSAEAAHAAYLSAKKKLHVGYVG